MSLSSQLQTALENRDFQTASRLLTHSDSQINSLDSEGFGVLRMAIEMSDSEMLKLILGLNHPKIDVDLVNDDGITALHAACANNFEEGARILLQNRADPNKQSREEGSNALHYACENDNGELVKALFQAKCDPNIVGEDGTPLHIAVSDGNISSLMALFDQYKENLDITVKDINGNTAFDCAIQSGDTEVINAFLKCSFSHNTEALRALLPRKGAKGHTSFHLAASRDHLELLKSLEETSRQLGEGFFQEITQIKDNKGRTYKMVLDSKLEEAKAMKEMKAEIKMECKRKKEEAEIHQRAEEEQRLVSKKQEEEKTNGIESKKKGENGKKGLEMGMGNWLKVVFGVLICFLVLCFLFKKEQIRW